MNSMNSEEILQTLEAQMSWVMDFQGATFELLEDYWALGDSRLSVFRSERLWAIAIEAVAYDARAEEFILNVWVYGNCLKPPEEIWDFTRPLFVTPRAWNKPVDAWGYARDGFAMRWRGQRYDFAPSLEELQAAGIKLSRREIESGVLKPQQALRYVCGAMQHPFFAGEDTLRDLLDGRRFEFEWKYEEGRSWVETPVGDFDEFPLLSSDLELFLQTPHWRHPRVSGLNYDASGAISIRDAFGTLAQAIASGDLTAWHAQDPSHFNSHWSHWAESEWRSEQLMDQSRADLRAEGERFQQYLATLPEEKREETLRALKEQWAETQRVTIEGMRVSAAHSVGVAYVVDNTIEIGDQTYNFGPHLWGEVDDTVEKAQQLIAQDFENDSAQEPI